jgi:hypothetical protein
MALMYFLGLLGVKVKEGFFIFLLFPMSSYDVNSLFLSSSHNVPMMLTIYSHQVLIMFPMIFHDVPNMFFKFPLYSRTHSQEHLTFIPYGLANVVVFSFIYIIKQGNLICFVTLRSSEPSCFGLRCWYLWKAIDE